MAGTRDVAAGLAAVRWEIQFKVLARRETARDRAPGYR